MHVWYAAIDFADLNFFNPASNGNLPGAGSLGDFINTFAWWGLMLCVAGIILSGITFALARTAGNGLIAMGGFVGLLSCGLSAALIGGAQIWVNHLWKFGAAWH